MIHLDSGSNHLEIDAWFPTCIGVAYNNDHDEWAPNIIKHLNDKKKKFFHNLYYGRKSIK